MKCECGVSVCGGGNHSDWCPLSKPQPEMLVPDPSVHADYINATLRQIARSMAIKQDQLALDILTTASANRPPDTLTQIRRRHAITSQLYTGNITSDQLKEMDSIDECLAGVDIVGTLLALIPTKGT